MSDDRDKLLHIMNSLEADYKSGKISKEKYIYFRSKYEDKLNSIDAVEATRRIRSMQGKPSAPKGNKRRSKRPAADKKRQEQDLVQKYIINPKKDDAKYNQKKKSSDGSTFRLLAILVLVIAFTAGVAYGVLNFDFQTGTDTTPVGIVQDTAFPEIHSVIPNNVTKTNSTSNYTKTNDDKDDKPDVETTTTTTTTVETDSTPSHSDSGGSSDSGGGSSDSGGGSDSGSDEG